MKMNKLSNKLITKGSALFLVGATIVTNVPLVHAEEIKVKTVAIEKVALTTTKCSTNFFNQTTNQTVNGLNNKNCIMIIKPTTSTNNTNCTTVTKPSTNNSNCTTVTKPTIPGCPTTNTPETQKPETQKPSVDEEIKDEVTVPDAEESVDSDTTTDSDSNTSTDTVVSSQTQFENKVLELVNEERAKYGLATLEMDESLRDLARLKSNDMQKNNYFSHTSPTYGTPFEMLKSYGISYKAAAENIAQGYTTPEAVVEGWMNSSGHRKNILSSSYTHIGIGYSTTGNYWTQIFIGK